MQMRKLAKQSSKKTILRIPAVEIKIPILLIIHEFSVPVCSHSIEGDLLVNLILN